MQPQNQPRPVSVPPAANVPLPPIPEDVQVTWHLRTKCRQRMPMLFLRTAVTQRPETDCKTLMRSHHVDTLDHLMSRNWPSSSHHHQMKRTTTVSTPGQDGRDSLSQKIRREGTVKNNNHCNVQVLCFPEISLWYFYWC